MTLAAPIYAACDAYADCPQCGERGTLQSRGSENGHPFATYSHKTVYHTTHTWTVSCE
jgi:hypothetical protein